MKNIHAATVETTIAATSAAVWKALTTPSLIKKYLHDTNVESDWKQGSKIEFRGQWKGKEYTDKGKILQIEPEHMLRYTWLSSNSGLEDKEENYMHITYELMEKDQQVVLRLTQENIASEEEKTQSEENWKQVLADLKRTVEVG